jgi:hypothetical protein
MKSRFALFVCILALGCVSSVSVGCGVTTEANSGPSKPSNPSQPTNPSNPASPTDPAATIQITTTQLPDGTANSPYTAQLAATGGTAPYVWSAAEPCRLA